MSIRVPLVALSAVCLHLLNSSAASGATRVVPTNYPTIQQAISASSAGDTVLVLPGTYVENIWIDRDITVRSQAGPQVTIIDGGSPVNPDHGSTVRIDAGTIDGFDIRNGTGWWDPAADQKGGGVLVTEFCIVRNNWIHDNHFRPHDGDAAASGAAVVAFRSSVAFHLISNRIYDNRIDAGLADIIQVTSPGAHVIGNEIFDHHIPGHLAALNFGEAEVIGNIIACNSSVDFAIVTAGGLFQSNTVVANWSDALRPAIITSGGSDLVCTLQSNNITHNVGPGLECRQSTRPPFFDFILECNNFAFNFPGGQIIGSCAGAIGQNGNISVDPEYGREIGCPSSPGNWCLSATSPLLPPNSPPGCGLIGALGECPPISIPEVGPSRAGSLLASAPHPNPFLERTTVAFYLPGQGRVEISIYGVLGRKVRTLAAGELAAGEHELEWDGRRDDGQPAASGAYVAVIQAHGREVSRTLLLVR